MPKSANHLDATVANVAEILREAERVLFVTGAGVSADSGLPTYRGVGGLYDGESTEEGVRIEEALSSPMFARRPELTWKYLWQIGAACFGAAPNAAHRILAEIEAEKPDVWVMTQNIDGLHRAAGSRNLVEVHGHMFDLYCTACGHEYQAAELLTDFRTPPALPPKCTQCQGIVRPRVVLFEEMLPDSVLQAMEQFSRREFDAVVTIGTSALFPYIQQPVVQAQRRNRPTVEINPSETMLSQSCQHRLPLGASDAMQRIRECMV